MKIIVEKEKRTLSVYDAGGMRVWQCHIALGRSPRGAKRAEGDGKTPEGAYYICLKRETGKFGCALGISYPSPRDALLAVQEGRIEERLLNLFCAAEKSQKRPPWGTPLGGEIYLHGGGTASDWTAGCIALEQEDMERLFVACEEGDSVLILP